MSTNQSLQFLNVSDGALIWNYEWPMEQYRAIQPNVVGNTIVFAGALGNGIRRLHVKRLGSSWTIDELWSSRNLKPDFNDFVEQRGVLYGFDGSIFAAVSLDTGKRLWKKGRYGNGQVLSIESSEHLLVISETGELILLRAKGEACEEVAKFQAIHSKTWNHPILVGNRVYVRNSEDAACIELPLQ